MLKRMIAVVVAAWLAALVVPVEAAITKTFDQSNFLPDGGNYGTVVVKAGVADGLAAGTVEFSIAVNPLRTGDTFGSFSFNTDLSLSPSQISSNVGTWTSVYTGSPPQDGFGVFTWTIEPPNQANDPSTRVASAVITVTGLGLGQDDVAHFFMLNTGGDEGPAYYAAHLFPTTGGTGWVAVFGTSNAGEVPEPFSAIIWSGFGIAGAVGAIGRRRRLAA